MNNGKKDGGLREKFDFIEKHIPITARGILDRILERFVWIIESDREKRERKEYLDFIEKHLPERCAGTFDKILMDIVTGIKADKAEDDIKKALESPEQNAFIKLLDNPSKVWSELGFPVFDEKLKRKRGRPRKQASKKGGAE